MTDDILIISSVQDFRLKRRGSIQSIAAALRDEGHRVTFLSIRFSPISRLTRDPRAELGVRANRTERWEGVDCFLWWTPFHPFSTRRPWLDGLLTPLFWLYARMPNREVDNLIRRARTVIVESGLGIILTERVRRLNPGARLIYRGSDRLKTISQHPHVERTLRRSRDAYHAFCLLGPGMIDDFRWAGQKVHVVPPGLNEDYVRAGRENPYRPGQNAVSLGAMLFDASFFEIAAPLFPAVQFHIFGVPPPAKSPPTNVNYNPEIPYLETARYVRHATIGIAPYVEATGVEYLADTSSKLLQYAAFGLPSVCPSFAVGHHPNRFGYRPGDVESIRRAVATALTKPPEPARSFKTWPEIVRRLLAPDRYEDTLPGPSSG